MTPQTETGLPVQGEARLSVPGATLPDTVGVLIRRAEFNLPYRVGDVVHWSGYSLDGSTLWVVPELFDAILKARSEMRAVSPA